MAPVIQTHSLTKIYGNKLIAVNGVQMTVEAGQTYGLLGPNGAGKTTLLKLLLGLHLPTAGRAELFGQVVGPNSAHLRRRVGYLPTNPRFPPTMSPLTYLDMLGQLLGMSREERKPRMAALIRAVDLLPAASRPIKTFSTGMTTRLGIAAALMNDPELLLWDEPTAGLDPAGRKYTLDLIRELGKTKTVVVSSHILSDIDRVCDYVGVLHDGKMIYNGSVRDLKQALGRNNVEIEVEGADHAITAFCNAVAALPDVMSLERHVKWISVQFATTIRIAEPLAHLLRLSVDHGVDVVSLSTTKAQTEEAFIHLLEVDQADGFARAYHAVPTALDGLDRADQGGSRGTQ